MSLKTVKNQIRAVKKIRQVTKAMEAVSAVKMRRSQYTAIEARPYALHAMHVLKRIVQSGKLIAHPLTQHHAEENKFCFIVITSDRGLAGALNSYVLREVHRTMKEKGWTKDNVAIIAVGKKGYDHFLQRGFTIVDRFEKWGDGVAVGDPEALADSIIDRFRSGEYDRFYLCYSNFMSTFKQEAVVRRFLPISFDALEEVIDGIIPQRGKYSELRQEAEVSIPNEYIFEPNAEALFDELLPYLLAAELYHAVFEANASEHSARMVAMKSASDRARDVVKSLTLAFNKERQSAITAEVSEITSGIEAMR